MSHPNQSFSHWIPPRRLNVEEIAQWLAFAYSDGEHEADSLDHEVAAKFVEYLQSLTTTNSVLHLYDTEGLSGREIAKRIGCSVSSANRILKEYRDRT